MDTKELLKNALSLADLGSAPEGPKGQLEAIQLAQALATIAIAQELARLNEQLNSVITDDKLQVWSYTDLLNSR